MSYTSQEEALMLAAGGKVVQEQSDHYYQFGYVHEGIRTVLQQQAHDDIVQVMPRLQITGRSRSSDPGVKKALLFELWRHPRVKQSLGFEYPGTHQKTGSCVGAGGGNALFTLIAADVIRRGDPEKITVPFWLLPYGRSRFYMGDRGPGEGSLGSAFAKAVREDGLLDALDSDLPKFENSDGLIWGERTEYSWSDGDAQQTLSRLNKSRQYPVKSTAQCKDADDVREALVNGYPCTCASMWGGRMRPGTRGTPEVLFNERSDRWSHQMSVQGWWDHPTLGELFWIHNQWGIETHGRCPSGAPGGGFWISKADMDWICRDEVFAFSQLVGFPAPDWDIPWIFAA